MLKSTFLFSCPYVQVYMFACASQIKTPRCSLPLPDVLWQCLTAHESCTKNSEVPFHFFHFSFSGFRAFQKLNFLILGSKNKIVPLVIKSFPSFLPSLHGSSGPFLLYSELIWEGKVPWKLKKWVVGNLRKGWYQYQS